MGRIWIVFAILIIFYSIIIARLFYWQVLDSDRWRLDASAQYYLEFTLPAARGTISASDGQPLVMNQPVELIYATPPKINDLPRFVAQAAPILSLDQNKLTADLSQPGRVWVPLAHRVEIGLTQKLKDLKLSGLGFEKESKRYYPESSMSAQLLGFVGSDENGHDTGYFGLEGYYDRELRGKDGVIQLEKDVKGAPILVGEEKRIAPQDGRNLVLWLDRTVQYSVQRRLLTGLQKYGAKEGSVVVMDPKTGGILAMASFPSYDPARFTDFDKLLYKNPIVASSYEPGSTFKVFVVATALENHAVTPGTVVDESGPVAIGEYSIKTWNNQYHGPITVTKVLEYSSNVGMVAVQRLLGQPKLLGAIHNFGFGEATGVDLQEEFSPDLRPDREWHEIDYATASFGQGIAVTPIQMVRAVGAIANNGWLMEPHVVAEIRGGNGKVVSVKPKKIRQVISSATANVLTEMMIAAVDNGEAKWAKPHGYRIAGKTGTAQIPVAGHYDEKKTIASFVGFAPADNPKFVMLVTLREPSSSPWGSETAAPVFFDIARDLFSYYGIPPQ